MSGEPTNPRYRPPMLCNGVLPAARHRWALVLAGGEGRRLAGLTRRLYGYERAKQFCAFSPEGTLLEQTLRRAARIVDRDRIVVMITQHQWREARECLEDWPQVVVLDQPDNRDTLPGILWPVLRIAEADPGANLVVLPSDHHIGPPGTGDAAFASAVSRALDLVSVRADALALLGVRADDVLDGLGWIEPRAPFGEHAAWVRTFREKPPLDEAVSLARGGALVNTFVMAARAATLLDLARRHSPDWWRSLSDCLDGRADLDLVYRRLPNANFSRDILARAIDRLMVVPMDDVRWSDIGTPERLADAMSTPSGSSWPALAASAVVEL